ncbi:MAG: fluoride efflux transporter CrcB [Candidatus Margulisiibacteriota bacterium]
MNYLAVFVGGGVGAFIRFIISGIDYKFYKNVFPFGTLVVNVTGGLAIGILWAVFERFSFSPNLRLFAFTGILGGYTTFSAFSLENFNLIRDGEYKLAILNILLSNILAIGCVFVGYFAAKYLAR